MKGSTVKAMVRARKRAEMTPDEVRAAFLQKRVRAAGIDLHPLSLGIVWLLDDLQHPLLGELSEHTKFSMTDQLRATYIFAFPDKARTAYVEGSAEGLDAGAHTLAMRLTPGDLNEIAAAIIKIVIEGLATIPGAGATRPPKVGENSPTRPLGSDGLSTSSIPS